jgi:hypothetical protein
VATTENKLSNPSSLAIVEEVAMMFYVRLLLRWKTNDPEIPKALIRHVAGLLAMRRRRLVKLCIDSSNEKFYATEVRKDLAGIVPVELVSSGETTVYRGEKMPMKTYLGNLYINTIDEKWVSDDARLVVRNRGGFEANTDKAGNHADSFDSIKLGLNALIGKGGGPAEAAAVATGTTTQAPGRWRNPFAHLFEKGGMIHA